MRFKEFISETYVNLLPKDSEEKNKHAPHVFHMLQRAYAPIGGLAGNGFKDHHDMVKNIHMWKLHKKNGHVHAAVLYKDKHGRKMVACASDGSHEGKEALGSMLKDDITKKRAHGEVSGPALHFLKKQVGGDLKPHAMTREQAAAAMPEDKIRKPPHDDIEIKNHPELKDHFYQRKLGDGQWHTKLMVGHQTSGIK